MKQSKYPGYWHSKEKIVDAILTTNSRSDFHKRFPGAAAAARRMNIYEELTNMMVEKGLWKAKTHIFWNKESCIAEIRNYDTVTDLLNNNMGAYLYARKHGFWDEASKRMKKRGSRRWRKIYVFEFDDHCAYVGLSFDPHKREKDHLRDKDSAVYIHLKEAPCNYEFKELSDFLESNEASIKEEETKIEYRNNGWTMLNRMKCGGLGALASKYTKAQIKKIASSYSCRSEFNENDKGAYLFAYKNGWLDEVCAGMPKFKGREEPTEDEILDVIKKCKNRSELRSHYTAIWDRLVKMGRLEEFFPKKEIVIEEWPDESINNVIKECRNRTELRKKHRGAYNFLQHKGRLDEFFPIPIKIQKPKRAKKAKKEIQAPKEKKVKNFNSHPTKEQIKEIASGYDTKMDFYHAHHSLYSYACKMGWLEYVFESFPKRAKQRIIHKYWTDERISEAVKDKPYKSEFREKYPGAYDLLQREGRLSEYFPTNKAKGPEKWNDTALNEIIIGCNTPADLGRKSRGALQRIRKDGRLDEFFPNRIKRK